MLISIYNNCILNTNKVNKNENICELKYVLDIIIEKCLYLIKNYDKKNNLSLLINKLINSNITNNEIYIYRTCIIILLDVINNYYNIIENMFYYNCFIKYIIINTSLIYIFNNNNNNYYKNKCLKIFNDNLNKLTIDLLKHKSILITIEFFLRYFFEVLNKISIYIDINSDKTILDDYINKSNLIEASIYYINSIPYLSIPIKNNDDNDDKNNIKLIKKNKKKNYIELNQRIIKLKTLYPNNFLE